MESESVFIVLGKRQNASPDGDGNWTNYWSVDVAGVFHSREDANSFIWSMELSEPIRPLYGGVYDAPSIAAVANLRKENEDYESQLDYYNRRFEIYEVALKKYEQDLAKYKTWQQESRDKEEKARQELKNSIRAKLTPEEMKFLKKEIDYV